MTAPPKELLMAQTENYVEYSRTGQVIKGQEKAKVGLLHLNAKKTLSGEIEIRRGHFPGESYLCVGIILGGWPMGLRLLQVTYQRLLLYRNTVLTFIPLKLDFCSIHKF